MSRISYHTPVYTIVVTDQRASFTSCPASTALFVRTGVLLVLRHSLLLFLHPLSTITTALHKLMLLKSSCTTDKSLSPPLLTHH
uniref:Uncharacterized protein n=1 Tax=Taenia asiatica TaxID=60517 RepID=A0A0R3W3E0_TAEAS